MSEAFNQLLDILSDEALAVPYERLRDLSDLDTGQMDRLRVKWDLLSQDRRVSIIKQFGNLADENIELTFEIINRYALSDPEALVRRTAIQNLWESEDHSLIPILLDILEGDPSLEVRSAAANGLGSFVLIAETGKMEPDLQLKLEEALLRTIQHEQDEIIHLACLESLSYSSRDEVDQFIQQAYDSGEDRQMKSALMAMGRAVNRIWQDHVIKELNNPNPEIRYEAAQSAGELEFRKALLDLIELVEDVNQDVRRAAIWSISQIGTARAGEVLSDLFEASDDEQETQLLEDALENFAFVDGSRDFLLLNFDEDEDDLS